MGWSNHTLRSKLKGTFDLKDDDHGKKEKNSILSLHRIRVLIVVYFRTLIFRLRATSDNVLKSMRAWAC
jgi:hypothetical protein